MPRRETPQGYWPKFDSEFLSEIAAALQKKSKSLKHSVRNYSCEKVREKIEGEEWEKLELSFEDWRPHPIRISFYCWDDRWMWLDIRQAAKSGWNLEWQHEGRIGVAGPAAVAKLLMRTVQFPFGEAATSVSRELDEQWKNVALNGPRGKAN